MVHEGPVADLMEKWRAWVGALIGGVHLCRVGAVPPRPHNLNYLRKIFSALAISRRRVYSTIISLDDDILLAPWVIQGSNSICLEVIRGEGFTPLDFSQFFGLGGVDPYVQLQFGNDSASVGCIAFNGHPETLSPLTVDQRELLTGIRDFTGGGSTSISTALQAAGEMLSDAGRSGSTKHVVLLSDGRQSPLHGSDKEAIAAAAELRT